MRLMINDSDYITVQEYADKNGVSALDLIEDIVLGKYQSAVCLINKNEECITDYIYELNLIYCSYFN